MVLAPLDCGINTVITKHDYIQMRAEIRLERKNIKYSRILAGGVSMMHDNCTKLHVEFIYLDSENNPKWEQVNIAIDDEWEYSI